MSKKKGEHLVTGMCNTTVELTPIDADRPMSTTILSNSIHCQPSSSQERDSPMGQFEEDSGSNSSSDNDNPINGGEFKMDDAIEENFEMRPSWSQEEWQYCNDRHHLSGPGGRLLIGKSDIAAVVPDQSVIVFCLTWNIAGKNLKTASSMRPLLKPDKFEHIADFYFVTFQELPSSSACFHNGAVSLISEAVGYEYVPYCWVRKWSQMLLVVISKRLLPYVSQAEWQFVPRSVWSKPIRTKGALAVSFRIFNTVLLLVGSHLSYASQTNRVSDYRKICQSLRFNVVNQPKLTTVHSADIVIWFGDLNFRMTARHGIDKIQQSEKIENKQRQASWWDSILLADQLTNDVRQGKVFDNFCEPPIRFAPSHKFIKGTSEYVSNRIPSFTDRILYRTNNQKSFDVIPLIYDIVWSEIRSDHKPVYAAYKINLIDSA